MNPSCPWLRWKSSDGRSGRIPTFDEVEATGDFCGLKHGKELKKQLNDANTNDTYIVHVI